MYKRWLSFLLSVAMMITLLPTSGLAAEKEQETGAETVPVVQAEVSSGLQQDDYYYEILDEETCRITGYAGTETYLEIPEKIGHYTVTSIGDRAFLRCEMLQDVILPASVIEIGYQAFFKCDSLKSIELKEGLLTVGNDAFFGCALCAVIVPSTVTQLGKRCFYDCDSLQSVQVLSAEAVLGEYCFAYCDTLQSVQLPEEMTSLPAGCFSNCISLSSFTLPANLTELGGKVFWGCTALEEIQWNDVLTHISWEAFYNTGLKELTLPAQLKTIDTYAFADCASLEKVDFNEGLESIEGCAFMGTAIRSLELPSTLRTLGGSAFANNEVLMSVSLNEGLESVAGFWGCSNLVTIDIPESVRTIHYGAFKYCTGLQWVRLPSALETIEESAFADCSQLSNLAFPDTLTTIERYAFQACDSLGTMHIPSSVTTLGEQCFAPTENLVFACDLNSAAATYAVENGIPILEEQETVDPADHYLDPANSWVQGALNGINASGNIEFVVQYALKEGVAATDMELVIPIQSALQLVDRTMTLDGSSHIAYTVDEDGVLHIPVTQSTGVLRFQLRPETYSMVYLPASLHFYTGEQEVTESIGAVLRKIPTLTLEAIHETPSTSVMVKGITVPLREVILSVDGVEQLRVTANQVGDYSAWVELGEMESGQSSVLTAQILDEIGYPITVEKTIRYKDGVPALKDFTIYNQMSLAAMLGKYPMKMPLVFDPSDPFGYTMVFDNPEQVGSVYVVSKRGDDEKILEGIWDEENQMFVARGLFDPEDPNYVPGQLSVEYIPKQEPLDFAAGFDISSSERWNELPEIWKNADVTVNENTDQKQDLTIELPAEEGNISFRATTEVTEIPSHVTPANAESLGYTPIVDVNGNQVFSRSYEADGGLVQEILDYKTDNMRVSKIMDILTDGVPSPLNVLVDTSDLLVGHAQSMGDFYKTWSDIYNSNLSLSDKADLLGKWGTAIIGHVTCTMLQAVALVGFVAIGAAAGSFAVSAMVAYGMVSAVLEVGKTAIESWMRRQMYAKQTTHKGADQLSYNSIIWFIDPSGYVYDSETEERLRGATVTVYWLPYDGTDDTYWDQQPANDVYGEIWDASQFSQSNPLITDGEGRYAWDVPEGWWRVKCEAEGYLTSWSDWVPVPPPQTEVHIGMIPIGGEHECVFTQYVSDENASCDHDGTKTAYCDYGCGASDTIVDVGSAWGHWFSVYLSDNNATCTEDGTRTAYCNYGCGATDTIPDEGTAGHRFTHYVSDNNATCVQDGTKTAVCDGGCGTTDTIIDVGSSADGNHLFTQYTLKEGSDCTWGLEWIANCDRGCGEWDIYQEEPKDHTWGPEEPTPETEISPAIIWRTCTVCGYRGYQLIRPETPIPLTAPMNLRWGYEYSERYNEETQKYEWVTIPRAGSICWDGPAELPVGMSYNTARIKLYQVGQDNAIWQQTVSLFEFSGMFGSSDMFLASGRGSGSYYCTVTLLGDGIYYGNSETVTSPVWEYVQPTDKLPTCNEVVWDGLMWTWQPPEDMTYVDRYAVDYYYAAIQEEEPTYMATSWTSDDSETEVYLATLISRYGEKEGWYSVRIRVLSTDISVMASSDPGQWSEAVYFDRRVYQVYKVLERIFSEIQWSMGEMTAEELRQMAQQLDREEWIYALEASRDTFDIGMLVIELEDCLPQQVQVEVTAQAPIADPTGLSVIGLNLNTPVSEKAPIKVIFDIGSSDSVLPNGYDETGAQRLALIIENVKDADDLAVPVKIMLPLSEQPDKERLDVLYRGGDGLWEKLNCQIWEKDGQWMLSFVVTGQGEVAIIHEKNQTLNFVDVPVGAWYYNAVQWAVEHGITSGTGDGTTFEPMKDCSRAEIVTFLWRLYDKEIPQTTHNPFRDVESGSWYMDPVLWAVERGITSGTGDGTTFEPYKSCSRAEVVTFLWRAAGKPEPQTSVNPFTDVDRAGSSWYYDAVLWAVENGITSGTGDGTTFEPLKQCSRAEIVTFLSRVDR